MIWVATWSLSSSILVPFLCQETVVAGPPSLRQVRVNSGELAVGSVWGPVKERETEINRPVNVQLNKKFTVYIYISTLGYYTHSKS